MMNWLRRFMYGRYGNDTLNSACLLCSIALTLLWVISHWEPLVIVILLLLGLCYFRMYSRNINKRYQENQKFLQFWAPMQQAVTGRITRVRDRAHYYCKCPSCKKLLRLPRGKGKIQITCPQCHTQFVRKT